MGRGQCLLAQEPRDGCAHTLCIHIEVRDHGSALHARDDGRGVTDLKWGNGLSGMRERFEEHAGRVDDLGVGVPFEDAGPAENRRQRRP